MSEKRTCSACEIGLHEGCIGRENGCECECRGSQVLRDKPKTGGVIIPTSPCCGAATIKSTGGVILDICSQCKKVVEPPRF